MSEQSITTISPDLAGACLPAFIFVCGWCQTGTPLYNPRGIGITKGESESIARANGWSKTRKLGWICPSCKGRKSAPVQAAPSMMMEVH